MSQPTLSFSFSFFARIVSCSLPRQTLQNTQYLGNSCNRFTTITFHETRYHTWTTATIELNNGCTSVLRCNPFLNMERHRLYAHLTIDWNLCRRSRSYGSKPTFKREDKEFMMTVEYSSCWGDGGKVYSMLLIRRRVFSNNW